MSIEMDVGEVKGRMAGMEKRMDNLENKVESIDKKLDTVLDYIANQKGGWKAITLLATAAVSIGVLAGKLISALFGH